MVLLNQSSDATGQQSRWNVEHPYKFLLIFPIPIILESLLL